MGQSNFELRELLASLSHHCIITGLGFAFTAAIINVQMPTVSKAMGGTASIFMGFSVVFWRLSNHE